ncbi:MAG: hypothetical protein V3S70_00895 [Gammaproteobacteria bacterium]
MKQLITLLLALFLATVSWSQDAEDPGHTEAEATELGETSDPGEEEDDADLDEQGYVPEEEEDDFIPSQEVSADQSVAFPVDI